MFDDIEDVTFYTAYGYRQENSWRIPLRLRVHEPQPRVEGLIAALIERLGEPSAIESENLRQRITDLLSDSESLEKVVVAFDNDPNQREWRVRAIDGGLLQRTDLNGNLNGELILPVNQACELLEAQRSADGWLSFRAVSPEHRGAGRLRLIAPRGLSVISDIDDTIKITGILDGVDTVLRNTFLRDFIPAPGMVERYRQLDAAFHYVSGAPWQLFPPLSRFLADVGYPEGSFHMKDVTVHPLSLRTWQNLFALLGDATVEQKARQIGIVLQHFPEREFILFGDSGEHDPAIYAEVQREYGSQIRETWIREVAPGQKPGSSRLVRQ